ncbi:hypothetical protein [Paralcaligenes ureilyticus]|uniref:Uncharacterized protein n=1 Tax=Paralcaligenes ureilyticus TaxID=627131 RepID=A0A4R3MCZ4_9BURK|nr:hypothetical protein [Paralcaligenes ureilyticus]TCT10119.1 hypothetical protein EDC26_10275 [Paralcaligenes ureilyticus]
MTKLATSDPTDPLIIVGALKDVTASSVQFSAENFTQWLALPTALIEEATYLGVVEGGEANQGMQLPLFSISLIRPQTQSEHFFFDLVMPPFFMATQNLKIPLTLTGTELV